MTRTAEKFIKDLLQHTDITINGTHPWDIKVHNEQLYTRIIKQGSLGLGEAYMEKWWDCDRLDMLFDKVLRANLDTNIKPPLNVIFTNTLARIINFQTRKKAREVAHQHYDLGNTLFSLMLDKHKMYSCAYFKNTDNLDVAQEAKLALSCEKLQLKPGMRLLDIGCGWGGLARYAAEKYGVSVVGVTISKEQQAFAKEYCSHLDVDIRLQDYRDIDGTFDRIISIGMFEHVGPLNYAVFMRKAHDLLADSGLFLLHTIGNTASTSLSDPWIRRYIFPNAVIPSVSQIAQAIEPFFVMEDWQNFGAYYDQTLMCWHQHFIQHWDSLQSDFDEKFYRMWVYYLQTCAGTFRARKLQLWQLVLSKGGVNGVYMAPR